ncbi:hypothetical protein COY62_04460 [bacterium (Candidatus Howlettbacteria) CG_4_10_14_0_8_um_filter_40_9]|nr:MAG: hypothetical protein COY62_04460 [bacterium (Candidatus Howlettbacteria) CG_4_10_14_0_8_um_filter_40_9]
MTNIEGERVEEEEKKPKKANKFLFFIKACFKAFFVGGLLLILGLIFIANSYYSSLVNEFKHLQPKNNATQTVYYDKNEEVIYESYGAKESEPVKLSEIPDYAVKATLAAEDLDYYRHDAYDLKGIFRAVYRNYTTSTGSRLDKLKVILDQKSYTEGGSTITQQLVKNRYLTNERSFERKVKEIVYAIELEKKYTKDEILEQYLSNIYYGEQALGIINASQAYYGKDAKDLTLAEASMLAGLPAAPTQYSPVSGDFFESKKRQEYVLQRMYLAGFITLDEAKAAANEELVFDDKKDIVMSKYPFYVDWVNEEVIKQYGKEKAESGGLKVYTSLDPKIQEMAEKKAKEQVEKFKYNNVSNAAVVVMDTESGEVVAMVGGTDYEKSKVNVATALRQPGSSFKPVVYYTGLENGYTAVSKFIDKYVNFGGNPAYAPRNYSGGYSGYVTMRDSLARSLNIPAVEMLKLVGLDKVIETADKAGLGLGEEAKKCGLSLALGCKEMRLIDLAGVYGTFANNGLQKKPKGYVKILDSSGENIAKKDKAEQIFDSANSYIITHILSDEKARRVVFGAGNKLEIKRPAAAKTGTTDNYTDSWTIGFTPDYLVGVWMGNNDRKPMRVISGIEGAAYIWHDIMTEIHKDLPVRDFTRPYGISELKINPTSGDVVKTGSWGKTEIFKSGTEPKGKEDLSYLNIFR